MPKQTEKTEKIEKKSTKTTNKIAVIDVNKVVAQSMQVQELKQEQTQRTLELQKWLQEVKTDVESRATNEEKQQLVNAYNQEFAKKQTDIKTNYAQKLQAIEKSINETISKEAKKLGFDMVLAKNFVLFGGEDITDKIAKIVK